MPNTIFKKLNGEEDTQEENTLELENINGYKNIENLISDYKSVYHSNYDHYVLPEDTTLHTHLEECKQMYLNSQNPKLGFFLLGNSYLLEDEKEMDRPIITKSLSENFHI